MSLKSRDIQEYFAVPFSVLRPEESVPFELHLYFSNSNHIVLWRMRGEFVTEAFLKQYRSRGVDKVWIHKSDTEAFEQYKSGIKTEKESGQKLWPIEKEPEPGTEIPAAETAEAKEATQTPQGETAEKVATKSKPPLDLSKEGARQIDGIDKMEVDGKKKKDIESESTSPQEKKKENKTDEQKTNERPDAAKADTQKSKNRNLAEKPAPAMSTSDLIDALDSPEATDSEKSEKLSQGASGLLAEAGKAKTTKGQSLANKKTREMIKEMLLSGDDADPVVEELFNLAEHIPELEHSTEVATYAVMFAMLSGKSDRKILGDLAVAGLIHDIGLCMLPIALQRKPWSGFTEKEKAHYSTHVEQGVNWMKSFAPEITESQISIVVNHHEKFDGTGYPKGEKGFALGELSQFLAMADLIISVGSGRWDGKKRPIREAVDYLAKIERKQNFPQYFNPELLDKVLESLGGLGTVAESAQEIAAQQKSKILKDAA